VTELSHAVFLSYASEDAAAAERIATALRGAGIEVWFDKSELRGGDAWDQSIRRQIKSCALFIPVISRNTDARAEGYFRLEWKLAVDRSHLFTATKTFLVPVAIDDTPDDDEQVPDRFRELQWMRLPGGETPPAFVDRVQHLLSGEASTPIRASIPAREHAPASSGSKRVLPVAVAGVIALVLLVVLGFFGLERVNRPKPSVPGTASIAVLPLANESGEASQQYFSDGISEDLITALSQFPGLKVIGRTSAFQFRDSKEDSRSIGAKLGVAHLLEGSVRKSGDMIRVSAELIDTADGSTQWSGRYDRPYKDLFALQDEITHAVAGALKTKLLTGEQTEAQSERPPSGSLEAYNAVLQGNFYLDRSTETDSRKAIEHFRVATQLDPRYALAWSQLSIAWARLGAAFLSGASAQEAYSNARTASDTAIRLAPDLADAHLARAALLRYADFDWRGAEAEARRAAELAPGYGAAQFYLGAQLATLGQIDKAIDLNRRSLATDPLHGIWHFQLGFYLLVVNRLDEAEREVRKAIELQPGTVGTRALLVMIEIRRSDAKAALAAAQQEIPGTFWQDFALAMAHQIGNDRTAADASLKTLIEKRADIAAYQVAEVYAVRKDADRTFDWLDRAWSNRDAQINHLLFDPFMLAYKEDPRFAAFCRKVGLPVPGEASAGTSP
jgi:TolB-like protein/Flp pilus assembly protein TadD